MTPYTPQRRVLYLGAAAGFVVLVVGAIIATLGHGIVLGVVSVTLVTLGSAILFPILITFTYDRLRERWLGDEIWRLFTELADAGIMRVYRDREFAPNRDNAQTRLAEEFKNVESGTIYIMGPSLRVFFNPLGPFYHDIEGMLKGKSGRVNMAALIARKDSPCVADRTFVEEPGLKPGEKSQAERDADSTVATIQTLRKTIGPCIGLRRFMPAPYCTAIIFPHVAYFSPNVLAPEVPVRLPMILFSNNSHGYKMLKSSFDYLWNHNDTIEASATQ
jgi:hypothetical protein